MAGIHKPPSRRALGARARTSARARLGADGDLPPRAGQPAVEGSPQISRDASRRDAPLSREALDTVRYISAMAGALDGLAGHHKLALLSHLLKMAALEADQLLRIHADEAESADFSRNGTATGKEEQASFDHER